MSYRPITDIWFLARAKLKDGQKYYGAYLGGFPERARALLGCRLDQPVLHVCGGKAKFYPYKRGFGPNDKTLDLDPATSPDFLQDARDRFPVGPWAGILMDPPYSEEDAAHYNVGAEAYPSPALLLRNAFDVLPPGGRVGIIHYVLPKPPTDAVFVAAVGVLCGFNNRIRIYSVFEKPISPAQPADGEKGKPKAEKPKPPRCGDCDYWMKSSLCPEEKNVNGWNKGPSMNGTPCSKFKAKEGA